MYLVTLKLKDGKEYTHAAIGFNNPVEALQNTLNKMDEVPTNMIVKKIKSYSIKGNENEK